MSLAQLGQRMGLTASAVSRMERYEPEGRVTLQQLEKAAQALHCRVVYALVPEKDVEELVSDQAMSKAEALVRKVDTTMALEDQQLSEEELNYKIAERAARYLEKPPKDFWVDDETLRSPNIVCIVQNHKVYKILYHPNQSNHHSCLC